MAIKPWKKVSEEVVFEKYGRQVLKRDYLLPDGKTADFYIKKGKNACAIFALTEDRRVITVRQYRPGPDRVLNELPGGHIDAGDSSPTDTISRELLEETGYSGEIQFIGTCLDDAYSTVERSCFVALNCRQTGKQELENTEFAEVELLTLKEFRDLLRRGQSTDVEVGYLALDHLKLL